MKTFMEQNGIQHQRTVPYTPEQNGCAEREMWTIMEAARSMIHAKGLDSCLWGEAVNSAVFILNRTGTSTIKHKTPYELWNGKSIEIDDFRIFGSEVFVHLPKQGRRKLDAKAKKCIFVGYDEDVKGFRVLDTAKNQVEVVRDVKFLLNEFSSNKSENSKDEDDIVTIVTHDSTKGDRETQQQPTQSQEQNKSEQSTQSQEQGVSSQTDTVPKKIVVRRKTVLDGIDEGKILDTRLRNQTNQATMMSMALLMICGEPNTYEEAIVSPDGDKWIEAMHDEYNSLIHNETWTLVEKPRNQKVIDNKWVYKVKRNTDNSIERFKARLVGRGFTQEYGIDYEETFSPVVRFNSIRTLLAIAAQQQLTIKQFDVKTAFLYGELDEDVYMKQPIGFDDKTGRVCKLRKSLYGLKQASRCWNIKFKAFIEKFGFSVCDSDPCVFISIKDDDIAILAIYVDDGIVIGNSEEIIDSVISHLQREFEVKTIKLGCFLGIEIQHLPNGSIFVNQEAYARKVLEKFSMSECNALAIPADPNQVLEKFDNCEQVNYPYRQLVGSLMYLAIGTRPDIAYAVSNVSRYLEKPTQVHVNAAKRILRYIKGTIRHGILYNCHSEHRIVGYSDADFAGDIQTRRSTSGFALLIANGAVSWGSQLQRSVSISTMESEYVSASEATRELIWLDRLANELVQDQFEVPILYVDNQSAIRLAKNPINHKRSKHIDVKYHFIREKVNEGMITLEDIRSEEQIADVLTKAIPKKKFQELRSKLGMKDIKAD